MHVCGVEVNEAITWKEDLLQLAAQALEERIRVAEKAMKSAQESANNEEKSSAGDKYETARAMSQLERDMNARQLTMARKELETLKSVKTDSREIVGPGALVFTETQIYFFSVGLGTVESAGKKVHLISGQSPIGKALEGLKEGSSFSFNGNSQQVLLIR